METIAENMLLLKTIYWEWIRQDKRQCLIFAGNMNKYIIVKS